MFIHMATCTIDFARSSHANKPFCRNPDSHRRPPFSDISKLLSGDINDILQTSLETGVLGQSLLDSKELYSELQYMYCQ